MSTQLFLVLTTSDYSTGNNDARLDGSTGGWDPEALSLARGGGFTLDTVNTVNGPTNGLEVGPGAGSGGTLPIVWYSPPLDADVTISGSITWNIWAAESNMSANVAINGRLEVVDGATGTITLIDQTARTTELAVTTRAVNNFAETPAAGVACKRGDRLRVRIFGRDAGTMASGFSFTTSWNGTSAGADGDTYLTLTENLTFASAPAGTTIYATDTTPSAFSVSDTGFVAGGTYENIDRGGLVAWANPGNASASDDIYAVSISAGGTDYLVCRNLGLSLPAGSTVRGVVIEVEGKSDTGGVGLTGTLWDSGAPIGVTNLVTGSLDSIEEVVTAGAQENNWNAALTEAVVEGSGFGVAVYTTDALGTISIDRIRVKVFYSPEGRYIEREAWTSRGAGVATATTAVPANTWNPAVIVTKDSINAVAMEWYTKPLAAFTLGGAVLVNMRALEVTGAITAAPGCEIAICSGDGTLVSVWGINRYPNDITTSEAAYQTTVSGDDVAVTAGQRLRIRMLFDDAALSSFAAAGNDLNFYYAGTSGGASGDTYLTFTQTLTELVAGNPPYRSPYSQLLAQ